MMPITASKGSSTPTKPTYTEYTYDGRGNATSIKDPKDNTTSYAYDALSRLTQMTQPLSTTTNQDV